RHFAAVLVKYEAVGEHDIERRTAARATAFKERGLKPAAMLVGTFQVHHRFAAAIRLALDMGERREMLRVLEHKRVRRAGIEPDIENVVDLLPALVGAVAEKALTRAGLVPGIRTFLLESLDDPHIHLGIAENIHRTVGLFLDEQRDW